MSGSCRPGPSAASPGGADDKPDMVERIFERFVSLDGLGGSGLGLAIGRELARAHGGELSYREGAFVLRLPVGDQNT